MPRNLVHATWIAVLVSLGGLLPAAARAHAPHDLVEELGISPDFEDDGTVFAFLILTDHNFFARSTDRGRSWEVVAHPMADAIINDFAFSPDFAGDGSAFCATDMRGVWRTTDRGLSWNQVTPVPDVQRANDVACSPAFATDGGVLAATSTGLFRSTDGGDTWAVMTAGVVENELKAVRYAPGTADPPVAYTGGKILHRSNDGGASWTEVHTFTRLLEALAISPDFEADATVLACFGRFGDGLLCSLDGGSSFIPNDTGLADVFVNDVAFASDGTLFAATNSGGCHVAAGVQQPFQLFSQGFEVQSPLTLVHYKAIEPSPAFVRDDTVFVGSFEGMFRSTTGGQSFEQEDTYTQRLNRLAAFSPGWEQDGTVFFGNYGAGPVALRVETKPTQPLHPGQGSSLSRSASAKQQPPGLGGPPLLPVPLPLETEWDFLATGVASIFSSAMSVSPAFVEDETIFYGYFGLWRSRDAGASWLSLPMPPGLTVVRSIGISPDYAVDEMLFVGSNAEGVWRSADAGMSWTNVSAGLPSSALFDELICSPHFESDQTAFLSTRFHGMYRSTDGGTTWQPIQSGMPNDDMRDFALSPDFASDEFILAGTVGDGLFRSSNGGDSWQDANQGCPDDDPLIIESVAFSPAFASDQTAFILLAYDRLFRSTDGAQSWVPIGDGLPRDAARVVLVSPDFAADRTVVVSTHDGVWMSRDAGDTFAPVRTAVRVDESYVTTNHYAGTWTTTGAPGLAAYSDSVTTGTTVGGTVELEFFGRSVAWHGVKSPMGGIAAVSIDEGPETLVDLYSQPAMLSAILFEEHLGDDGWHTIRVRVTGDKNPASGDIVVVTDGWSYEYEPAVD